MGSFFEKFIVHLGPVNVAKKHGEPSRAPFNALNTRRSTQKVYLSAPKAPKGGEGLRRGGARYGWEAGHGGTTPPTPWIAKLSFWP